MIMTINEAQKLVKRLQEQEAMVLSKERNSVSYTYFEGETPVVPEYNFEGTQSKVTRIEELICKIKHLIRKKNFESNLPCGITPDEAVLEMAFLNRQKDKLINMSRALPKTAQNAGGNRGSLFTELTYSPSEANALYNKKYARILDLQNQLNFFNLMQQITLDVSEDELEKIFSLD